MLTNHLQPYRLCKTFSNSPRYIWKNCLGSTVPFRSINMSTDVASKSEGRNKLKFEKSPYLLQHQSNPVNWYPWGEEAFKLAKAKEMPIFLSIGYSTCHWCHVMERESFENVEIANVMNKYFVNIKMDREERPDIDRIYMTFVQAVSGSGGWPMSVWMTPDLKPFYGGTYYPPEDQVFGRPGFKSLLLTIADQWKENRQKFTASASKILEVLEQTSDLPTLDKAFNSGEVSKKCFLQLARSFEPAFGGFSDHPKFPQPVNINFLIYFSNSNPENVDSIKMIDKTLKCIAMGGIHDHIGKGFCRYSTDKKWHVPHFEKMLYDNAQLVVTYINAFLLTKDIFFARIAEDVIEYVNRDMSHDEGGFYSAEDADSYPSKEAIQKVEGAFYVWSKSEIDNVLESKSVNANTKLTELFHWRYGVRDNGNVDPRQDPHNELKHKNVLYIGHSVEETAKHFLNVTTEEVRNSCAEAKSLLFDYRNRTRPRPGLDTKFIASWNGLMISAFARAGVALNRIEYTERGVKAMNFAKKYFISPTGDILRSCYREGDNNSSNITNLQLPIMGCVDDFCNLVSANLDLFDATWNLDYLLLATQHQNHIPKIKDAPLQKMYASLLQKKQDEIFWDSEKGGYFNSRDGLYSIVRFKDDDDGAEPSSNSASAVNLIRLFSITEKSEYQDKLRKLFQQFSDRLVKIPMSLPLMAAAYDAYTMGTKLILILKKKGANQETTRHIRRLLLPLGSTVISINVDDCPNLAEWKAVIPCVADKIDDFSARDVEEVIYLGQGDKFTVYSTAEFQISGYAF